MGVLQFAFEFQAMECGECGIAFAVTQAKYSRCKEKGESWFCPNGHERIFGKSEVAKLQEQLETERKYKQWANERADRNAKWAEKEKHRAAAFKGVITKTKKRVGHGVCPCCTRSFENLKRHMTTKHPEFANAEVEL